MSTHDPTPEKATQHQSYTVVIELSDRELDHCIHYFLEDQGSYRHELTAGTGKWHNVTHEEQDDGDRQIDKFIFSSFYLAIPPESVLELAAFDLFTWLRRHDVVDPLITYVGVKTNSPDERYENRTAEVATFLAQLVQLHSIKPSDFV